MPTSGAGGSERAPVLPVVLAGERRFVFKRASREVAVKHGGV
jgi:hypothetical protein